MFDFDLALFSLVWNFDSPGFRYPPVHWLPSSSSEAAGENPPDCVHVCFFHQHGWPFTCSAWPSQPPINHSAAIRLKWIWKYWETRM